VRLALPIVLAAALAASPLRAAGDDRDPDAPSGGGSPANRVTPEHQRAIDRGVAWLASKQEPSGAFPTRPLDPGAGANWKGADYQTAVTALSTLALVGAGHGLRHGPYRARVRAGVNWLLKAQDDRTGYVSFTGDDQSKMHGHGYATLALAEAYATATAVEGKGGESADRPRSEEDREVEELSRRLRSGVQRAVRCIEGAQSKTGGWGYTPGAGGTTDHEGSVTVCQVQALQAAMNRGFVVSLESVERARRYMQESQVRSGGFLYRLGDREDLRGANYSWSLAAAGAVSLLGLAEYDKKAAYDRAMEFLERHDRRPSPGSGYYFYGSFYAVQAYHWAGGERWERYWSRLRADLLRSQDRATGAWDGQDTQISLGPVYPTAFCLLMLEVPVGYLSIYAK
jgi:hypothetical protein